jgi:hypothetical protein
MWRPGRPVQAAAAGRRAQLLAAGSERRRAVVAAFGKQRSDEPAVLTAADVARLVNTCYALQDK